MMERMILGSVMRRRLITEPRIIRSIVRLHAYTVWVYAVGVHTLTLYKRIHYTV